MYKGSLDSGAAPWCWSVSVSFKYAVMWGQYIRYRLHNIALVTNQLKCLGAQGT